MRVKKTLIQQDIGNIINQLTHFTPYHDARLSLLQQDISGLQIKLGHVLVHYLILINIKYFQSCHVFIFQNYKN